MITILSRFKIEFFICMTETQPGDYPENQSSQSPTDFTPVCLNCGASLHGAFCAHCGQKDIPRRQNIRDLFVNFIGSFTSFDSKFFRTIRLLLFKPGMLTLEYNAGKREKYFHPARMYVFLSFIFFLTLSLIPEDEKIQINTSSAQDSVTNRLSQNTSNAVVIDSLKQSAKSEIDSSKNETDPVEDFFERKLNEIKTKTGATEEMIYRNFFSKILDNLPKMIFLLLPVFAVILKFLYIRRDFYYAEHLVFTVFFYDFMFLTGTISMAISQIKWLDWIPVVFTLWILFYLYKMMRKVYKQRRFKTIIKYFLLLWIFSVCLGIGFLLNAVITLILM